MAEVDIGKELFLDKAGTVPIGGTGTNPYDTVFPVLGTILKNVYVISAIILFIMVFVGGLGMILNAGNAEKQKQSSQALASAVLGFAIMFASYWLIKIIELITGLKILSLV